MEFIQQLKVAAVELTSLDRDSLHVHVSVAAFLLASLLLRQKARTIWPWLAVLVLALIGEYIDGQSLLAMEFSNYPDQETLWRFHGKDLINTMIAPTALMLAARFTGIFDGISNDKSRCLASKQAYSTTILEI